MGFGNTNIIGSESQIRKKLSGELWRIQGSFIGNSTFDEPMREIVSEGAFREPFIEVSSDAEYEISMKFSLKVERSSVYNNSLERKLGFGSTVILATDNSDGCGTFTQFDVSETQTIDQNVDALAYQLGIDRGVVSASFCSPSTSSIDILVLVKKGTVLNTFPDQFARIDIVPVRIK